jgi:hypothetical protein
MSIFKRRRAAVVIEAESEAVWQPDGDEPEVAPGSAMDDDGCVSDEAYGVTFLLDTAPRAQITIWTYTVPAEPGERWPYLNGHRYEYRVYDQVYGVGREPWIAAVYDAAEGSGFADLDAADEAAQLTAMRLAVSRRDGGPDAHSGHLDWDGVPW